jgi:hypothetical protein
MAYILNRSILTKRIIDTMVFFLREKFKTSRLYENVSITDRFQLEAMQLPMIIVRSASASARRTDFQDYIDDVQSMVELVPIAADSNLVGNNLQKVNLADGMSEIGGVSYDPRYPFDSSIGYPSGTDISVTVFTSGNTFPSDIDTGVIINIPPPRQFEPNSITYGLQIPPDFGVTVSGTGTYNLALALNQQQDQFYLIYSGNGTLYAPQAVFPNQWIVAASGIVPALSGVNIKMSDVLYAGDQYELRLYNTPRIVYERYGGIYDISIQFDCYGRTTIESQELSDLAERFLNEKKFDIEQESGAHLLSWEEGGGSELEHTNEPIFQNSVSCTLFVEWFDLRSVGLITGYSGTAIPTGLYASSGYLPPGVYNNTIPPQIYNSVNIYASGI